VAVIAPAGPVDSAYIKDAITVIKAANLNIVLGQNVRKLRNHAYFAAPLEERFAEFMWAWESREIHAVWAGSGGYGCAELLPLLPFERIRQQPKIFIGFSDITALSSAILARTGLVTFNGPNCCIRNSCASEREARITSLGDALNLLMSTERWRELPFQRNHMLPRIVASGRACGVAVGGNLSTLAGMLGTQFFPFIENTILFLEDTDFNGYDVDRTLTHLKLAGVFKNVIGVVFGEFVERTTDEVGAFSIEEVIRRHFEKGPPTVVGLNFSHGATTAVIPIGAEAEIDTESDNFVHFGAPLQD
jgi:muramoyltetrapeptide carboxypeptidase